LTSALFVTVGKLAFTGEVSIGRANQEASVTIEPNVANGEKSFGRQSCSVRSKKLHSYPSKTQHGQHRLKLRKSRKQFAAELGISQKTLWGWETDRWQPSELLKKRIGNGLKL
jgi:DNA-binding transcriptional regulator YiaG